MSRLAVVLVRFTIFSLLIIVTAASTGCQRGLRLWGLRGARCNACPNACATPVPPQPYAVPAAPCCPQPVAPAPVMAAPIAAPAVPLAAPLAAPVVAPMVAPSALPIAAPLAPACPSCNVGTPIIEGAVVGTPVTTPIVSAPLYADPPGSSTIQTVPIEGYVPPVSSGYTPPPVISDGAFPLSSPSPVPPPVEESSVLRTDS